MFTTHMRHSTSPSEHIAHHKLPTHRGWSSESWLTLICDIYTSDIGYLLLWDGLVSSFKHGSSHSQTVVPDKSWIYWLIWELEAKPAIHPELGPNLDSFPTPDAKWCKYSKAALLLVSLVIQSVILMTMPSMHPNVNRSPKGHHIKTVKFPIHGIHLASHPYA